MVAAAAVEVTAAVEMGSLKMGSLGRQGGREGSLAEVVGGLRVAAVGLHIVLDNLGRVRNKAAAVVMDGNGGSSSCRGHSSR